MVFDKKAWARACRAKDPERFRARIRACYEKHIVKRKRYARSRRNTPEGKAQALVQFAKVRAKQRGWEFALDQRAICERIRAGSCEVTGLPFVIDSIGRSPWSPSIDRIDRSSGYTMDNIKVVVTLYNCSKMEFTHNDVVIMAKAVLGCEPS